MKRQPTDDEIEDRLAGEELMFRQAIKGDKICGAAIALQSLHPYLRTMVNYGEEEEDEVY